MWAAIAHDVTVTCCLRWTSWRLCLYRELPLRGVLSAAQVRLASVAENAFNAVERISEFCDLPQEAPEEIPETKA